MECFYFFYFFCLSKKKKKLKINQSRTTTCQWDPQTVQKPTEQRSLFWLSYNRFFSFCGLPPKNPTKNLFLSPGNPALRRERSRKSNEEEKEVHVFGLSPVSHVSFLLHLASPLTSTPNVIN